MSVESESDPDPQQSPPSASRSLPEHGSLARHSDRPAPQSDLDGQPNQPPDRQDCSGEKQNPVLQTGIIDWLSAKLKDLFIQVHVKTCSIKPCLICAKICAWVSPKQYFHKPDSDDDGFVRVLFETTTVG